MSTLSLFPVKIFKATYNCDLTNLKEIVLEKISSVEKLHNQSSMRGNGFCSYNVLRDLNKIKEFSLLVDFINDQSQLYWKELQYATHMKPVVYEMWANVYKVKTRLILSIYDSEDKAIEHARNENEFTYIKTIAITDENETI
jgi:hypothetical protein